MGSRNRAVTRAAPTRRCSHRCPLRSARRDPSLPSQAGRSRAHQAPLFAADVPVAAVVRHAGRTARIPTAPEPTGEPAQTVARDSGSRAHPRAGRRAPAGGLGDGLSCEAAAAAPTRTKAPASAADRGPADLSAADYARVLNRGDYLGSLRRAGQRARGRVRGGAEQPRSRRDRTSRRRPRASERCVARAVRRLAFPSHPRLDVARTRLSERATQRRSSIPRGKLQFVSRASPSAALSPP